MAFEFKLPDIGEGLVEGEIVRWLVAEGDKVEEDEPIVEVMTDKATVEITSPRTGTIAKLLAKEGDTVLVDAPFVIIEESGGSKPTTKETVAAKPSSKTSTKETPASTTTPLPLTGEVGLRPRTDASAMILPPIPTHRVLAAPAVRRLAKERGVDLTTLRGSGAYGRVLRDDVENFQTVATAAPPKTTQHFTTRGGDVEEEALRGMRKRIALQMQRSKFTAPHFTYVEEVDMTPIVELREELRPEMQSRGVSLTYLPFIFKAVVNSLKEYPLVNSSLDDDRGVIIKKRYYNFGISVATDAGLTVPVVKAVDKLNAWEIAAEIGRLSTAARDKTIKVEELQDSTFTITSVGNIGGVLATPIINYPEAAIMGVNKIRESVVVREGKMVIRQMMYLSTSFDHRLVDGDVAAHFTSAVVKQLEAPKNLAPELRS